VVDERKNVEMEGALLFDEEDEGRDGPRGGGSTGAPGDGKAEDAMEFLSGLVFRMGLQARVTVREDQERVVLDVAGPDAGRAIGKKGQTLDALQFLVNKVVNRFPDSRRYIVVDSGDYRDRHDEGLMNLAKREAKRAVDSGRVVTLEPMPARDRRVIHLSLSKFTGIQTKSSGEGIGRRIQIIPAHRHGGGGGGGGGGRDRDRGPRGDRGGGGGGGERRPSRERDRDRMPQPLPEAVVPAANDTRRDDE
jgi:spoIIIJ-associated protein